MFVLPEAEAKNFIDTITGLTSVKRFHGHPMISEQTVADHCADTGMMAYMIALEFYGNEVDAYRVCTFALFHDLVESASKNDCNSCVKAKYGIRASIKQLETDIVSELFPSASNASLALKKVMLEQCSKQDYELLKIADTLSFGLRVWYEVDLGNKHLIQMKKSFERELEGYSEPVKNLSLVNIIKSKILSVT